MKPAILDAMWPALSGANPASRHGPGIQADRLLTTTLASLADALECRPSEIVLTSGGTESDNLAVKGIALASDRGRHVVTSAIEHPAVMESCAWLERNGFDVTRVPVNREGLIDASEAIRALRPDTCLVSIHTANSEVGTLQPVAEVAAACRDRGVPVHTDAVQAAGWLAVGLESLGVDALSISGHKLGTPKGIGLLCVRSRVPCEPLIHGGGQQRGRRGGTVDVAAALALDAALRVASGGLSDVPDVVARRDRFVARVLADCAGANLIGDRERRLANNALLCFSGVAGESLVVELDRRGIAVSSGSACGEGSDESSPVLMAMGVSRALAATAIRVTLSHETTDDELDAAATALRDGVAALRPREDSSARRSGSFESAQTTS